MSNRYVSGQLTNDQIAMMNICKDINQLKELSSLYAISAQTSAYAETIDLLSQIESMTQNLSGAIATIYAHLKAVENVSREESERLFRLLDEEVYESLA